MEIVLCQRTMVERSGVEWPGVRKIEAARRLASKEVSMMGESKAKRRVVATMELGGGMATGSKVE